MIKEDSGVRIEDVLSALGVYASITHGRSMRPLFCEGRDVVYISPLVRKIKKYDVILYTRDEKYILHRVIGFSRGVYVTRGDNTYKKEYVVPESVIGILTEYNRCGKHKKADTAVFRLRGFVWNIIYPIRALILELKRKLKK